MENSSKVDSKIQGEALTASQKQRVNAIYHIYGDDSARIVKVVNGKGIRAWKTFLDNALRVYKARSNDADYYSALTHSFEIGILYSIEEISRVVNEERADLGLDTYFRRIDAQCEEDFLKVFYVEIVYEEVVEEGKRGKFIGYRPILKIKA
ncbi:hypothetical protein ACFFGT_13140 [Mucilaginibacter angelicae]|uniref:Uncharacterized protein n=1 Tax=Mucilaginibacter angelicae TaxID=869718 RepID=A0ABV6L6R7_9SPHI